MTIKQKEKKIDKARRIMDRCNFFGVSPALWVMALLEKEKKANGQTERL